VVEDRAVVVNPSVHAYLEARRRSRALGATPPSRVPKPPVTQGGGA
jgi:hypothetical protein